jgi:hypothetical protein
MLKVKVENFVICFVGTLISTVSIMEWQFILPLIIVKVIIGEELAIAFAISSYLNCLRTSPLCTIR